jgi:hypothetical protein
VRARCLDRLTPVRDNVLREQANLLCGRIGGQNTNVSKPSSVTHDASVSPHRETGPFSPGPPTWGPIDTTTLYRRRMLDPLSPASDQRKHNEVRVGARNEFRVGRRYEIRVGGACGPPPPVVASKLALLVSLKSALPSWKGADRGRDRPITPWSVVTVGKPGRPVRIVQSPNSCRGRRMTSPHQQGRARLDKPGARSGA